MSIRIILFAALVFMAAAAPTWLFALLALAYAGKYTAYELVVLTALVDAYYGTGIVPYYTLAATFFLILIEWVKPRLFMYNEVK